MSQKTYQKLEWKQGDHQQTPLQTSPENVDGDSIDTHLQNLQADHQQTPSKTPSKDADSHRSTPTGQLHVTATNQEGGANTPGETDLLEIARAMLQERSQIPDIHISLIKTRMNMAEMHFKKDIESETLDIETESGRTELEELERRELELLMESERIEKELSRLRERLHKAHRTSKHKWNSLT